MNLLFGAISYIQNNRQVFEQALITHLELSGLALLIGFCVSAPLGVVAAKHARISTIIMSAVNGFRVIPSLAILVLVMPVLGTGFMPSLVALTILACPPVLINTFLGIKRVEGEVIESAEGMGMDRRWILWKIELPLASPLMISGVRTAAVEVISSATLAAFIGGGGLGTFIINGLGLYNFALLLVGALPVAILAICSELLFSLVERWVKRYRKT